MENRPAYGMTEDVFDLAAANAMAILRGQSFNDANKRTAHQTMDVRRDLNGCEIDWEAEDVGGMIVRCAQGLVEDGDLAEWLRERAAG